MAGMNKILQLFVQTRVSGNYIDVDIGPIKAIRQAEKDGVLHKFKKDTYICMYKTIFKKSDAIIIFITMQLPGLQAGSSAASEMVMDITATMEKLLVPLDSIFFDRFVEGNNKNIGTLLIIKKIRETDML